MNKALIAMSGGVDSSVAAYLTKKAGAECIGVNMRLFDNEDAGISREKSCCSLDDAEDARSVAYRLDIPFYVFNFSGDFKINVIDRFIAAYENGETPNPCTDCNRYIKFDSLFRRAELLGCNRIVTGHYARVVYENGQYFLKKAADETKDQTYMLYTLTQKQLSRIYFPLGELTKTETRRIAEENGFVTARKKDSQDICFVPDGDYQNVIRRLTGKDYPPGNFIDKDGNILGTHSGIINYTVGQRRGLGIAFGKPVYVCAKCIKTNEVILGEEKDLYSSELYAGDVSWTSPEPPAENFRASVMIRYRRKAQPALIKIESDRLHVIFDEPQRAISPGQAAVIYDGDTVLGGGTILS